MSCFDLYVINVDGTNLLNLTDGIALDTTPAWSADGHRIAFASDRTFDPEGYVEQSDSFEIYIMDLDGSNVLQLTTNDLLDKSPTWSPNGQQLAYVSDNELHLINSDGSNPRRITDKNEFTIRSPVWLPDGQQIAFVSGASNLQH